MKSKSPRKTSLAVAGVLLLAGTSTSALQAADSGYVLTQRGEYISTGTGGCLLTTRWTPEMAVRECHPEIVAAREAKEQEMKRAEIAALEKAKPITRTPQMALEEISLDATTLFDFGTATLRPDGMEQLDQLADRLRAIREITAVIVEGHTDPIGSESYNEQLSRQRAEAVSAYLTSKGVIDGDKVQIVAQGERQLIRKCENLQREALINCLQPNRRVEVKVMGKEERPAK
ncbi:MAG: peptidoglycan-binding outer membrane protein RmpM [Gammaproteobacteria bacterium]